MAELTVDGVRLHVQHLGDPDALGLPVVFLHGLVMDNLASFGSKNAVFFAEKLLTLTEKNPTAVYLLGSRSSRRRVLLRERRLPQGLPTLPDEPPALR